MNRCHSSFSLVTHRTWVSVAHSQLVPTSLPQVCAGLSLMASPHCQRSVCKPECSSLCPGGLWAPRSSMLTILHVVVCPPWVRAGSWQLTASSSFDLLFLQWGKRESTQGSSAEAQRFPVLLGASSNIGFSVVASVSPGKSWEPRLAA